MKVVNKPWGKEEWIELNDKYCYKRIYINSGYKTSFQYHDKKRETNYIIDGIAEIWLENDEGIIEKKIMNAGEYFNVIPPKKHRVIALTDIILQEVSTPEVNDVIRIEDDTNRKSGLIDGEHSSPAVLILSAGLGLRLKEYTKSKNKSLIPINNRAIISYIIDKFPKTYEIIIAVGYKKESLKEYCQLSHPDRTIKFVDVDKWEVSSVGPGYSTLKCKEYLQRPFYITTADCLIETSIPYLDGNWLGVYPTSYPEKYSTIQFDKDKNVLQFLNKSTNGFDYAFIGLAGVLDYKVFWEELENNIKDTTELVPAWYNSKNYPVLKVKELKWFDTGNLDDIEKAKEHFNDVPLSLQKNIDETTYKVGNKFLKFNADASITKNRFKRGQILSSLVPNNLKGGDNFISYDWENGTTLYSHNSLPIYKKFLSRFEQIIKFNIYQWNDENAIKKFYIDKTNERKFLFTEKYGENYCITKYKINGKQYDSIKSLFKKLDFNSLINNQLYSNFHGDLQFDNIIYNPITERFTYIDWRESFAGLTDGGDLYYDLSKLYSGCILPYNLLKQDSNVNITEGPTTFNYTYKENKELKEFKEFYELWIENNKFNLDKIKFITGLIYLNMSPLHSDIFNKILWFKSIEVLHNVVYK